MSFINVGFLDEYRAEFHYKTVELPEDKSVKDLNNDWNEVRCNGNCGEDTLENSINLLVEKGYIVHELKLLELYEFDLAQIQ